LKKCYRSTKPVVPVLGSHVLAGHKAIAGPGTSVQTPQTITTPLSLGYESTSCANEGTGKPSHIFEQIRRKNKCFHVLVMFKMIGFGKTCVALFAPHIAFKWKIIYNIVLH